MAPPNLSNDFPPPQGKVERIYSIGPITSLNFHIEKIREFNERHFDLANDNIDEKEDLVESYRKGSDFLEFSEKKNIINEVNRFSSLIANYILIFPTMERRVGELLDELWGLYKSGEITRDTMDGVKLKTLGKLHSALLGEESNIPKERWPQNKLPGEMAIEFLERVWGENIKSKLSTRSDLARHDHDLSEAVKQYYSRKLKEVDTGKISSLYEFIPMWIVDWLQKKAYRSSEEVDRELEKYNISEPKDAYQRELSSKDAHRLYIACKQRMTS